MSDEDEIVNMLLGRSDNAEAEVHYNHYGDRGVVDAVVKGDYATLIYEVKSDAAIEAATGANEIIRQFNRHREYFMKGSNYGNQLHNSVHFMLAFTATDQAYQHVMDNFEMYASACSGEPHDHLRSDVVFIETEIGNTLRIQSDEAMEYLEGVIYE